MSIQKQTIEEKKKLIAYQNISDYGWIIIFDALNFHMTDVKTKVIDYLHYCCHKTVLCEV